MTFWDFLDRQIARVKADAVAGAGVYVLALVVLHIIVTNPELAKDDLFKTLAQAIIVQGLIGLAMAAWFTKQKDHRATGKPEDPVHVEEDAK